MHMEDQKIREDARKIMDAALHAALPDTAVEKALAEMPDASGRLILVAAGKAAWQMAAAAYRILGERIDDGIVITKHGHAMGAIGNLTIREAGHPVPDADSYNATEAALTMTAGLKETDTVLFLLSGGGSALFEKPLIPPEEMDDITRQLLACGADVVNVGLCTTPGTEMAVIGKKADGGIIITASHNPKEYNGYKAYWDDGAQVLAPHDTGIIEEVNKVKVDGIRFEGNKSLIQIVGKDIDDEYLKEVHSISIDPEVIRRQKDLSIVYTPLHGTGMMLIPQSLKLWGFENVHCVPEQMVKSGDFPTVVSPNPENPEGFYLAVDLAKKNNADFILGSDPDADRCAV